MNELGDKMNITELFSNAFNYSIRDLGKLGILTAFFIGFLILYLISIASTTINPILGMVLIGVTIIFFLVMILVYNGYMFSVIKDTVVNKSFSIQKETLPEFNFVEIIINGLKLAILWFIYRLIPLIVGIIFIVITILSFGLASTQDLVSGPTPAFSAVLIFAIILWIVFQILYTFFTLLAYTATGRLAETSDFGSIFEFKEIFATASRIGWGNFVIWFIILLIIGMVIIVLAMLPLLYFPYFSVLGIIALIFIPAFLIVFESRAVGLIYNESKQ